MDRSLFDEAVYPTDLILSSILGDVFPIYLEFLAKITSEKYNLTYEWRYYKDGKSWLLKICYKKKTIIWSSVNTGSFNITFYLPNRPEIDIDILNISSVLKQQYKDNRVDTKKSNFITIIVKDKSQLDDIYTLIEYKKSIK